MEGFRKACTTSRSDNFQSLDLPLMMTDERDSENSASLNNTDEEIKVILSQQDNVEETVGNTLLQKYVEETKLHFNEQIAVMKFYM